MLSDTYVLVEDDDALERLTHSHHTVRLVVLFLLAHKEEAYLGIRNHKLNLLLGTGGIEGDGYRTDAPCAKVAEEILDGILGEDTDILLHLHPEVQQGVRYLLDRCRELVPGIRLPRCAPKIPIYEHFAITVLFRLIVNQY